MECSPWNSLGQNTGVGSLSLLQGIFSTPWVKPKSPPLQTDSLPAEPRGKPKNTGVDSLSLLQQIFPTQESNGSPASQADSLPSQLSGKPKYTVDAPKVAIIIVIWLLSRLNHSFSHCQLELSQIFCYYSRLKLLLDPLNSFCLFSPQSGYYTFHLRAQSCLSNQ